MHSLLNVGEIFKVPLDLVTGQFVYIFKDVKISGEMILCRECLLL